MINEQLISFLNYTKFFTSCQYGFRKNSNTAIAATELLNYIYHHLDKRRFVVTGLFIDLKKAFDTVNHEQVLDICYRAGIRGLGYNLIESYLQNRSQAVSVNGVTSQMHQVTCGVPQGSVIGPTLFLMLMNDISAISLHGNMILYADDAALFYASEDENINYAKVNEDLESLQLFFSSKKLVLNVAKTKLMNFYRHSRHLQNLIHVHVRGEPIETVSTFEYLGLKLDSHLTWANHCSSLCRKLRSTAGVIFKLRKHLPRESLMSIYYAFAHSHLSYMTNIWGHAAATYLKPVQTLQNRCLKNALNLDRLTRSVALYTTHAKTILPVKGLFIFQLLKFVKQVDNSEVHHTIDFQPRVSNYNLRNVTSTFHYHTARTDLGQRQIAFAGPQAFNRLSHTTRLIRNTEKFLRAAKRELLLSTSKFLNFVT